MADKRRKGICLMAFEYKDNKCYICYYNRCNGALKFYQVDSDEKDFGISAPTKDKDKVKTIVLGVNNDKFYVLCI